MSGYQVKPRGEPPAPQPAKKRKAKPLDDTSCIPCGGDLPPYESKPKSKQARETAREDRAYAKLRLQYLEVNPACVLCGRPANQIHHILRGANRRRGLLNTDTWLGCCSIECHNQIERFHWELQAALKMAACRATIERLRK